VDQKHIFIYRIDTTIQDEIVFPKMSARKFVKQRFRCMNSCINILYILLYNIINTTSTAIAIWLQ